MSITVKNHTTKSQWVSINKWGNDGDTREYEIKPASEENWDRTDTRGFVMTISDGQSRESYFAAASKNYVITKDGLIEANGDSAQKITKSKSLATQ